MTPTDRGWSDYRREFVRGLNTEVTWSLTSAATVLVELVEGHHSRDRHVSVPRFTALERRLNRYVLLVYIRLLVEVTVYRA